MVDHPDLEQALKLLEPPVVSITTAGKAIGLSKDRSYDAARSGQIPVLPFGKQQKVPTAIFKRMLGLEPA